MSTKNDLAFPRLENLSARDGVTGKHSGYRAESAGGLTKLEWFAGHSSIPWEVAAQEADRVKRSGNISTREIIEMMVSLRFVEAERMVAESEKRK